MSDPKLISPMLDNFVMGDPISDHNGVRCCPALEKDSDNRYIVKIISTPASRVQLDALLLSGAYSDEESACAYFKTLADGVVEEAQILQRLSQLEGFVPFECWQIEPTGDEAGFDTYLLSTYKSTLQKYLRNHTMTHLEALNLGLDMCAALTVCRRSGYLYANLKPSNIYITPERGYRIGDLGFLKLDALKYASLPERYRSQYTAPEIADAFSALNTTIDIYAAGLILYQVFNNGSLPFTDESAPAEAFPPPAYADYEIAEIILKACAPDPSERWQDPMEFGQALVAYMQRNGAHDTPIIPVAQDEEALCEDGETGTFEAATTEPTAETTDTSEDSNEPEASEAGPHQPSADDPEMIEEITEDSIYSEDEDGNLTFLSDPSDDETTPGEDAEDIEYNEISDEVSDMLLQADELIAHQAPEPVVQPEPIDVPIPPPLVVQEEPKETEEESEEETAMVDTDENSSAEQIEDGTDIEETDDPADEAEPQRKASFHWIRNVILVLLSLALLIAGIYYYKNYYLQPIDAILLEESDEGVLTVLVTSNISEDKLTVVCSDTYGNQLLSPVTDGRAVFTGLAPNSAYTVKVVVSGFHRLTGDTSAAYTTPLQTNIVQFSAVTGSEDGSIILGFAIDGPDASQWRVSYVGDDGNFKESVFAGHTVTLTGFTIGNPYTFTLSADGDQHITGVTEVTYTASKIVKANNLMITGCANQTLTAAWSAPEGVTVDSWTVRCYSDNGFDETTVTDDTTASFSITDDTASYTVEVTAAGMSVSERAYAAEDSVTVQNFSVDAGTPGKLTLSWDTSDGAEQANWVLLYCMDNSAAQEIKCSGNQAEITPFIPGCTYSFSLQSADGASVLGGIQSYKTEEPANFSGYGVSAEHMEFMMCRTPSYSGWDRYDLSSSDYTTEFSTTENASFLVRMHHEYNTSDDTITTLFVIRNESGVIVDASTTSETWTQMWRKNYCELDIPSIPKAPGNYSVSVYFNGNLAGMTDFSVVSE